MLKRVLLTGLFLVLRLITGLSGSRTPLIVNSTAHVCSPGCDGSPGNGFLTLGKALVYISGLSGAPDIDLLFETSQGNSYTIAEADLSGMAVDATNGLYYIGKSLNSLRMMPNACRYNSITPCIITPVGIHMTTESVVFMVNNELTLFGCALSGGAASSGSNTLTYGLFEVWNKQAAGLFLLLNSSLSSFTALQYSYFLWVSYPTGLTANLTLIYSNFTSSSLLQNLVFLNPPSQTITVLSCEITTTNIPAIFASTSNGHHFNISLTNIEAFSGIVLSLASSNTLLISLSSFSSNTNPSTTAKTSLFTLIDNNNATLTNCSFSYLAVPMAYGGVISLGSSNTMTIANTISTNLSSLFGSFLYGKSSNRISINTSSFSNCSSYYDGGVLYLDLSNQYQGYNNLFQNNNGWKGGAIYSNDSNILTSQDSSYLSNHAFYLGNSEGGLGGGIALNKSSNLSLNNEFFGSNSADGEGGGLFSNYSNYITIDYTTFSQNKVGFNGGGISFQLGSAITVRNSSFLANSAGQWGGGAYCYSYNIEIIDSYLSENTAVHASAWFTNVYSVMTMTNVTVNKSSTGWGLGGMFYWYNGNNISIVNSTFLSSNYITWSIAWVGGVFAIDRNNSFILTNAIIRDSLSANTGGVFYIFTLNKITMSNISIVNSQTNGPEGGVLYVGSYNNVLIEDMQSNFSISANIAGFMGSETYNVVVLRNVVVRFSQSATGGVFYANQNNSYYIDKCEFYDSNATAQSGMLGTWTLNYLVLNNSIFRGSSSPVSGFSYLISFNTFIVQNCSFKDFSATGFGGVIGTSQSNSISILNSSFTNSFCAASAGVVLLEASNSFVSSGVTFTNSSAGVSGGAIVVSNNNMVSITACQFIDTIAYNNIGGVFFIVNGNTIMISGCLFQNASIAVHGSGGHFLISSKNTLTLSNNTYQNCLSPGFGGIASMGSYNSWFETGSLFQNISIYNLGGYTHDGACFQLGSSNFISLSACQFLNISGQNSGGLFYLSLLNTLFVIDCRFYNVSIVFAGAILYAEEQNNCIFQNVTGSLLSGKLFGTGFYVLFSNVISLQGFLLDGVVNSGASGGFGYFKDLNQFNMQNSVVSNGSAASSGGFIYAEISNSFIFYNTTLTEFSSGGQGGLFYLSRNNYLMINESMITAIKTIYQGGVIYAVGSNMIILTGVNASQMTAMDWGSGFYLTSLNTMTIEGGYINDSRSSIAPGSVFSFSEGNIVSLSDTIIQNFQMWGNIDYFYGVLHNQISLNNLTISIAFSQIFLDLQGNHSVSLLGLKVLSNSSFNSLVYMNGGQLIVRNLTIKFNIRHAVFHLTGGAFGDIRHSQLMPAGVPNYTATSSYLNNTNSQSFDWQANSGVFLVVYLGNATLTMKKSLLLNPYKMRLGFLSAKNGTVLLKSLSCFGMNSPQPGAFAGLFDSKLRLSTSVVYGSKGLSGSALYMNFSHDLSVGSTAVSGQVAQSQSYNYGLNMTRNRLIMNTARLEGGAIMYSIASSGIKTPIGFLISNNRFELNKAWVGGAVHLNNAHYGLFAANNLTSNQVQLGQFSSNDSLTLYYVFPNSSEAKGGAIHSQNSSSILSQNNNYSYNQADIGGAVYSSTPFVASNDVFNNNSAMYYGSKVASTVISLTFLLQQSLYADPGQAVPKVFYTELDNVVSGGNTTSNPNYDCLVIIAGIDSFGNLAFKSDQQDPYASEISYTVTNMADPSYTASLLTSIQNGQLCILGAQSNQLPLPISYQFSIFFRQKPTNLTLVVSFRDCQIGERLTDDYRCVECAPGYYSFQTVFSQTSICLPCTDQDPFVCLGGNMLMPKPGYWRSDPNSKNFIQCAKPDACEVYNQTLYKEATTIGNEQLLASDLAALIALDAIPTAFYTGSCQTGYSGPFCNSCDTSFGKMGALNCILCSGSSWFYYFLIILQIVLKVWYLFYCVLMAFKMIIAITMKSASEGAVIAMNMLKILIIHIQILSFLLKIPLDWSDNLKNYLPILFSFSPDISESFNFECFMKSLGWTLPEQYFILILCPIYILLIFVISLIFVTIRKSSAKNPEVQKLSNYKLGLCVFFIIIILTYIDLSKVNLEMFQCLNISDPKTPDYRLVNDVSVDCNSLIHEIWKYIVAVPVLCICVLLVVLIFGRLTYNFFRGEMDTRQTKLEFGYFYYAYKRKYYFWDFMILLRRLLILFFFLFFYGELTAKALFPILLMVLTLFLSLSFQIYVHPFETEYELINDTEQYSLIALCLSYVIMLMYATFYFNGWVIPESLFLLTILSILVINVAYLCFWVHHYYVFYFSKKVRTFVQALRDTIRKDGAVWLERLQKEHHIIFKLHNYFFKKQFLLGDINEQTQEFNAFYSNSDREELGLTSVYAKLLSNTMKTAKEGNIPEENNPNKSFDELFEVKAGNLKPGESIWSTGNAMKLRLTNKNLKQALLGEEVVLYESPMGKFKITYKKILKGRHFYTYQLINEVKIVGELEGEMPGFDVEERKSN